MNKEYSKNRHLIMLAHRIPYPPNKGEKIRSFNQIRYLQKMGWNIHLCALVDDISDLQYEKELEKYCKTVTLVYLSKFRKLLTVILKFFSGKPLSVGYFYSKTIQNQFNQLIGSFFIDSVLCSSSPMAEYLICGKKIKNKQKIIQVMDLIDVDSVKWKQYAAQKKSIASIIYFIESCLLKLYETKIVDFFTAVTLVSSAEVDTLRSQLQSNQGENIYAVGNGVDLEFFSKKSERTHFDPLKNKLNVIFFGRMDYYPNEDAVVWFVKQVMPLIRRKISITLSIVGAKPSREVIALSKFSGVEVTGEVKDIRPYVLSSDICVFPLRMARGIQNKVLEAMAMAKPIVVSKQAFTGIKALSGKHLIAVETEPNAFAEAVLSIWKNNNYASFLASNAHKQVHQYYSWDSQLKQLHDLLV
ncbi:MAG: TIGR03087 family PEP-CTERM/XrtA system glycosyltransferase [Desulfobacter sp.]|nr:MAG: TIGR03087 family PEP-CTERM/XrtA system glycosyltransferase [Desulfobacter sp.]